jgi:hypothetical protein
VAQGPYFRAVGSGGSGGDVKESGCASGAADPGKRSHGRAVARRADHSNRIGGRRGGRLHAEAETEMPAEEENFASLARINRKLISKVEVDSPPRVVLDMDSTEVPVYGQQEQSAYNGHFEST